jgi:hypothetical protein
LGGPAVIRRAEDDIGEELVRKVGDWRTSHWHGKEAVERRNPVLYGIEKGREYEEVAKSSEGEVRMIAAIAAVGTLRSYGENPEAQKTLPVLKTVMPGRQYSQYEQCINDSIAREQGFQFKAVLLFERVIPTKEDSTQKAALAYLCGELHRRLGNWDKAKSYYELCLAVEGHPSWLEEWVKEQRELLPK